MAAAKRHHYLPVCYQDRFTKDGYLWVYDRNQQRFRREQPKNTAIQTHYYSLQDEQGKKDASPEHRLAWIDGQANLIITRIEGGEPLSPRERVIFGLWLGVLYCRTPGYERAVDELITGHAKILLLRNLRDPVARTHFTDPAEGLQYVESDRFRLRVNRNWTIQEMFRQGREIGRAFFASNWVIARAPSNASFITSDMPIGILAGPSQDHPVGVVSPEVIKAVPLSPRVALLMIGDQAKLTSTTLTAAEVRDVNISTIRETENYAISRDKTLLRKLVDAAGLSDPKIRSRMVVKEFPDPSGDAMKSFVVAYRAEH